MHRREQEGSAEGAPRPIERQTGLRIVRRVTARAGVFDDGRLGAHVLRKTLREKSSSVPGAT